MNKALRDNIHDLDPGLTIVDGGKERHIPGVGNIDILAKDAEGRLVVIELKPDHARDEALAQVLDYVQGLVDEGEPEPHAMLIAAGFSRRLRNAARRAGVELVTYGFSFTFARDEGRPGE